MTRRPPLPPSVSGYALLLSVLILSVMLAIGLTVTGLITRQVRLTTRVAEAMRALSAADSGIERSLYLDLKAGGLSPGSYPSADPPFNAATYRFDVTVSSSGGVTTLRSTGQFHTAQRSVEVTY
jgi:hypothetical protein